MSWESSKTVADKHASGGKYVRLKDDGDKVQGVFVGEPESREVVYDKDTNKYHDIETDEGKKHVKAGKKTTAKFLFNFFEPNPKAPDTGEMKIYECGIVTFKDILKCRDKYGLDKKVFEIERRGKKGDTKTTYNVLPETDISDALKASIAKAALHNLKEVDGDEDEDFETYGAAGKPKEGEAKGESKTAPKDDAGDKPVDDATKGKLVAKLRELGPEKLQKFCSRFGIGKIKELKMKDAEAADKFIDDELIEKKAPAAASNDPFAD